MAAEIFGGLSAAKTAFDLARGLKDINDEAIRNQTLIDLQRHLLEVLQDQRGMQEQITILQKRIETFERWEQERQKYELREVYRQGYAYAIKDDAKGRDPQHWLCASCYDSGQKSILQRSSAVHLDCPKCKSRIQFTDTKYNPISGRNHGGW
jgi:hypothetical protein